MSLTIIIHLGFKFQNLKNIQIKNNEIEVYELNNIITNSKI